MGLFLFLHVKGGFGKGKGLAIKKKIFFLLLFYFLLPFKNHIYFILDNLLTYHGHITLKCVDRYFYWFVTIFSKK